MSAGTSISGGIGGIFYLLLLAYAFITRISRRRSDDGKERMNSAQTTRRLRFIVPILAVTTFLVLLILNLANIGILDIASMLSKAGSLISEILVSRMVLTWHSMPSHLYSSIAFESPTLSLTFTSDSRTWLLGSEASDLESRSVAFVTSLLSQQQLSRATVEQ